MRAFRVAGSRGVSLAGIEHGPESAPPIVFVHGFAASSLSFQQVLEGPLSARFKLIAFDLRGHGESDKPEAPESYSDGARWAEDLDAVIHARRAEKPVIVAWSYGGVVVGDYLRRFGSGHLGGVVFVGAPVGVGRASRPFLGPAMLTHTRAMLSDDESGRESATRAFLSMCTAAPLRDEDLAPMMAIARATPLHVRRGMFARNEGYDEELRTASCPVLAMHGALDQVILPSATAHVAQVAPGARAVVYEGTGHLPFLERAADFERDLASFAGSLDRGYERTKEEDR